MALVNVYQLHYRNGPAQGFGDYLRGCFCLHQVAKGLGMTFNMDMCNHPMSKYLENRTPPYQIPYANVLRYFDANYVRVGAHYRRNSKAFLIKFIEQMPKQTSYFLFCNSFPIYNHISQESIDFIKERIRPSTDMVTRIENYMKYLKIYDADFYVMHVRCGDDFLNKPALLQSDILKIANDYKEGKTHLLLLSDNNSIKNSIKERIPDVIIDSSKKIAHLGCDTNDFAILDTLLDFYVMSKAKGILSISPYSWGSGFSQWCSVIYGIPFKKIILQGNTISGDIRMRAPFFKIPE